MTIDIFPNDNFTIMEWCDVCRDKLLAKGTYTFENCIITFQYTDIVQKNYKSSFPNEMVVYHGRIQKDGYVTGSEFILINPEDSEAASKDVNFKKYFRRDTWYTDWETIYKDQINE